MSTHPSPPPSSRLRVQPGRADAAPRVGDRDRDATAEVLREAVAEGYLDFDELDRRLEAAYTARSGTELAAVTADLPAELRDRPARAAAAERARRLARLAACGHVMSYLAGMTLMVGIWLAVGVAAGAWYPWPIWPALGWGIGVAAQLSGTPSVMRRCPRPALDS